MPSTPNLGDHIMTSRAHCAFDDILYSADQEIMFTELLNLRITDFARAIEFGEVCQDPSRGVLPLPSGPC
jgi:hypothetical protein